MRVAVLLLSLCAAAAGAEKVTILRDEFGVPHIFASTPAGAAFGSGYAQAEDRLEELFRNYRKAEGTMAEAFGAEWYSRDCRQRIWRHREVSRARYKELPPLVRAASEAFQAGVRKFMEEHPEQVPAWAPNLEPWQVVALGRFIIWGWPEGEVAGKLARQGIAPDPMAYRGSNEMLLAPWRTAMGAPIAVIDPHLSWYGEFRFYEVRLYGKDFAMSGAAVTGLPFPSLGHGRHCSVAMTTGGPDTSDIYEEEVSGDRYKFRGEWKPLQTARECIGVKDGGALRWREVTIQSTHHGPIVAHKGGKAYAAAIPYAEQVGQFEQLWNMMNARNLAEMKRALAMRQLMAQNIMAGTVDGDIYYVRNGRVPIRPAGCDPSKPLDGAGGACEWQGIHPFEDLVQIENPASGYMQNCNVSPFAMMKDSLLVPEKWAARPYLYNASRAPAHQRGAMMNDLLERARKVTDEQAIEIAFSTQVWRAEAWQERIRAAAPASAFGKLLAEWNRRADAGSRAALGFYLFKMALGPAAAAVEPPAQLTGDTVRAALEEAARRLETDFPPDATYGTLFRVGREGSTRTWPVGGGTVREAGMATPRAINFRRAGKIMLGNGGQTSTQIVILTRPPRSYMVIPLGESDHPASRHFEDQAERLFSAGRAKSTYFLNRAELEKHVTARKEMEY